MKKDNFHMGMHVEKRIKEIGMTKAEFGRRIATSRQNVNTLLRKSEWSDGHITQASLVLGENFFEVLSDHVSNRLGKPMPKPAPQPAPVRKNGAWLLIDLDNGENLAEVMAFLQARKQGP